MISKQELPIEKRWTEILKISDENLRNLLLLCSGENKKRLATNFPEYFCLKKEVFQMKLEHLSEISNHFGGVEQYVQFFIDNDILYQMYEYYGNKLGETRGLPYERFNGFYQSTLKIGEKIKFRINGFVIDSFVVAMNLSIQHHVCGVDGTQIILLPEYYFI